MTANGGLSTVRMLSVTVVSGMPSSMIDRKRSLAPYVKT
jgi:hypothetical protein